MLSSRLNLVELFFADITRQRMRRCVLTSVEAIKDAIHDYLDRHNADRKPFKWTKSADVILAKTARALAKLYAGKNGNKALEKSSDSAAARLKERSNAISGR